MLENIFENGTLIEMLIVVSLLQIFYSLFYAGVIKLVVNHRTVLVLSYKRIFITVFFVSIISLFISMVLNIILLRVFTLDTFTLIGIFLEFVKFALHMALLYWFLKDKYAERMDLTTLLLLSFVLFVVGILVGYGVSYLLEVIEFSYAQYAYYLGFISEMIMKGSR